MERTIGIYNSASEAERAKRARDLFYAKRLTHRRTMTAQEIEDSALPFEVNQGAGFETYDVELVTSRHKTYPCWQGECMMDFYLNPMTERDLTKPLREWMVNEHGLKEKRSNPISRVLARHLQGAYWKHGHWELQRLGLEAATAACCESCLNDHGGASTASAKHLPDGERYSCRR